MNIQL